MTLKFCYMLWNSNATYTYAADWLLSLQQDGGRTAFARVEKTSKLQLLFRLDSWLLTGARSSSGSYIMQQLFSYMSSAGVNTFLPTWRYVRYWCTGISGLVLILESRQGEKRRSTNCGCNVPNIQAQLEEGGEANAFIRLGLEQEVKWYKI